MQNAPPFRADMVGSLLRTARLKDARAQRVAGAISAEQLSVVEDEEITALIAQQEAIGLEAVTDGEFRRSWWHYDFFKHLVGVEMGPVEHGIQFAGVTTRAEAPHVVGKIDFDFSIPSSSISVSSKSTRRRYRSSQSLARRCCTTGAAGS